MTKPLLAAAALAVMLGALGLHLGAWRLPDRYNPWAPLSIEESPGMLTRFKLARLKRDAPSCRAVLAQLPWDMQFVPDRQTGAGCGFRNAVRIDATALRVGEPFTLSCPAAVSLAMWERHVVLPASRELFGEPVARLEQWGSYACRNVYSREGQARSRHATADALDVAGFVLAGGRRITIARDWHGSPREARFLRQVHAGACRFFDGALGPGYNDAHADHFHLDRGSARLCR